MVFFLVTLLLPNLPGFDPLQFVQFSFIGGFKNFDHTSLLHDIIFTSMSETSQHFHQKYAKITQKSPQDLPLLRKQRRSQFVLYCWCLSTLEYDPVHFLVLWTLIKNWIEVISISVFEFSFDIDDSNSHQALFILNIRIFQLNLPFSINNCYKNLELKKLKNVL